MTGYEQISIATDGASRGNPGPAAIGYSIYASDFEEKLEEDAKYIGKATNNEAEYSALIWGLERAIIYSSKEIIHYSDSQLLVKQLTGEYSVKSKNLKILVKKVKGLKKQMGKVLHKHVPRENKYVSRVDKKINTVLDEKGY